MAEREFWMVAYCAALSGGASTKGAAQKADQALRDFRRRWPIEEASSGE